MLGIISAAGNALRAFGTVHPAIKWGVVVLAGLLAVELIGREGVALYRDLSTTRGVVEKTNAENLIATKQAATERLTANQLIDWQHERELLTLAPVVSATAPDAVACRDQLQEISPVLPVDRDASQKATLARCLPLLRKLVTTAQ